MTTTVICSVYDSIANLYGSPFTALNAQTATRSFIDECHVTPARGPMQTHPSDFQLFQLGTFDDTRGEITLLANPEFLCRGAVDPAV